MSVVGRAYVTVRAVTRQVEGDITDGVERALKQSSAKAAGERSGRDLGESIGKGVGDSDGIGDGAHRSLNNWDIDNDGRHAGTHLGQAIGDGLFADNAIDRAWDDIVARLTPTINEDGDKEGRGFGAKFLSGFGKVLSPIASGPGLIGLFIGPAVTQGLTAVSGLAAGATATIATLGPAAAAAGAVGAAGIGTLISAIGAVTLALKVPTQQLDTFKASIGGARDEGIRLAEAVQRQLLPALSDALGQIAANLGPTLERGLGRVGAAVGDVSLQFAHLSQDPLFQRNLGTIFASNADALVQFGGAGTQLAEAMVAVAAAASPLVDRFADWITQLTDGVGAEAALAGQTGALQRFFEQAGNVTAQWGNILGDTGKALFNVFSIGETSGRGLLESLEGVTDRFRDFTESASGRNQIADWFEQAKPIIHDFGELLGATGKAFGALSGDGGALHRTLTTLTDAMGPLAETLNALSGGAQQVLAALLPAIGELATGLAPAISDAAAAFAKELGPALDDLIPSVVSIGDSLASVADEAAPAVALFGHALAPAFELLADAVSGAATIINALPGPVNTLIFAFAGLKLAINAFTTSETFGPWLTKLQASFTTARAEIAATEVSFVGLRAAARVTMASLGPIGVAFAAVSIAVGFFTSKQEESKKVSDALTTSFDEQTGALTNLGRTQIVQKLATEGFYGAAQTLGLAVNDVTEAVTGNEDAYKRVTTAANLAFLGLGPLIDEYGNLRDGATESQRAVYEAAKLLGTQGINPLKDSFAAQAVTAQQAASANQAYASATGATTPLVNAAAGASRRFAAATIGVHVSADAAERSLQRVSRAVYSVNSAQIKGLQATIGYKQAVADATKTFNQNKRTLNLNTQAGRDNVNALIGIANAAGQVTGSAKKQQAALEGARQKILDFAKGATNSDGAAKKLTDKIINLSREYGNVPKNVDTTVKGNGLQNSIDMTDSLANKLNDINGNTYSYTVVEQRKVTGDTGGNPGPDPGGGGGGTEPPQRRGVPGTTERSAPVNVHNYNITVNNPTTERTSDSLPRSLRRARDLGIIGRD